MTVSPARLRKAGFISMLEMQPTADVRQYECPYCGVWTKTRTGHGKCRDNPPDWCYGPQREVVSVQEGTYHDALAYGFSMMQDDGVDNVW